MKTALALALLLSLATCSGNPAYATCFHDCEVDDTGYSLIKRFEGFSPFIYKDTVGVPTVGFGHAILPGEDIRTPLMGPDALNLLKNDVGTRTKRINGFVAVPVAPEQFDALASFAYNVGLANLQRSTLLRKVNEGENESVHAQFLLWDKAGGRPLAGLRTRREAEAKLYDEGIAQ